MADEKREILIDVEVESKDFDNEIGKVNTELAENKKLIRELSKDYKTNAAEIAKLEAKNRELSASKKQLIKESETESNSLNALRLRLAKLTAERNNLDTSIEGNIDKFNELQKEIKETTEEIKGFEAEGGDFRRNVGNYPTLLQRAGKGFDVLGTAIKATGIGLLIALLAKLGEAFLKNQKVADFFATAIEAIDIVLSDLVNFIIDNTGPMVDFVKSIFEDPIGNVQKLGQLIKENIIERFRSLLEVAGFVADAFKNLFSGDFEAAWESAKNAGEELIDVYTGVDNSLEKGIALAKQAGSAIADYGKEVLETAKANVELTNSSLLAVAQQSRLIEQYDRQAEQLRQIRDEERNSISDRIDANNRLAEVLEKQQSLLLEQADLQIESAKAQLDKNNNIENQVALTEALANREGILAQIEGFRSEQKANDLALDRERLELIQSRQQAENELAINERQFLAESFQAKLEALAFEREIELERLQLVINSAKEGTQARVDAESEFLAAKQDFSHREIELNREAAEKQVQIAKDAADKQAQIEKDKAAFIEQQTSETINIAAGLFEEGTTAAKIAGLAQIAYSTGVAVVKGIASAQSIPFPGNLAAMAATLAQVFAGISQARKLFAEGDGEAPSSTLSAPTSAAVPSGLANVNASLLSQFGQPARTNQQNTNDVVEGISNLPPIYVAVEDINKGQNRLAVKVSEAQLG